MTLITSIALYLAAAVSVAATLLPFLPGRQWWLRCWEFPRLQIGTLAAATAATAGLSGLPDGPANPLVTATAAAAALYQFARIFPYTPLARTEVADAGDHTGSTTLTVMVSNVLMHNREAARLLELARSHRPDVLIALETDQWWHEALQPLADLLPHTIAVPKDNTYGMVVMAAHPLEHTSVEYLISKSVPSVHTDLVLPAGTRVRLHAVHPEPPAPDQAKTSRRRDAELLVVGRRAADEPGPVVVAGDLNDVAWSPTTSSFQKASGLLDPRKGRGLYSSFHAGRPLVRWPLDHLFHSHHFSLVRLRRLPHIGSDHFPILVTLALTPPPSPDGPPTPPPDQEDAHRPPPPSERPRVGPAVD